MNVNQTGIRALLLGAAIALGTAGCASWHRTDTAKAASAEKRGPVETVSDASITATLKSKFATDDLVKARNINIDTVRGVVTLNGTVNSAAEKERALNLARNASGVVKVNDNLKMAG